MKKAFGGGIVEPLVVVNVGFCGSSKVGILTGVADGETAELHSVCFELSLLERSDVVRLFDGLLVTRNPDLVRAGGIPRRVDENDAVDTLFSRG